MCRFRFRALVPALLLAALSASHAQNSPLQPVLLPPPRTDGEVSLEKALAQRRSERTFAERPLSLEHLAQLLWAGQGITSPEGFRTAPSAGALYPLELYAVVQNVESLQSGVYHYLPDRQSGIHWLEPVKSGEIAGELSVAAFDRATVTESALAIVINVVVERTAGKYGVRAPRYAQLEAGHAAQNMLLQAAALGLAAVPVGSFDDAALKELVGGRGEPIYLISVGHRRR